MPCICHESRRPVRSQHRTRTRIPGRIRSDGNGTVSRQASKPERSGARQQQTQAMVIRHVLTHSHGLPRLRQPSQRPTLWVLDLPDRRDQTSKRGHAHRDAVTARNPRKLGHGDMIPSAPQPFPPAAPPATVLVMSGVPKWGIPSIQR